MLVKQIARAVLVIPVNFEKDLRANHSVEVQVVVDGSNATNATAAAGYLQAMAQDYSTKITLMRFLTAALENRRSRLITALVFGIIRNLRVLNFLCPD